MEFLYIYAGISVLVAGWYTWGFFINAVHEFLGEEGAPELLIRLYMGVFLFAFMLVFWPIFVATDTRG